MEITKIYCKKSSLDAVATEVKNKAGLSQTDTLPFSTIASTIESLVIPEQQGSPSITLTESNKTCNLPRGVYTGGQVSVTSQQKTASLSTNDITVLPDTGKVLSSVIVPASGAYNISTQTIPAPSKGATSITVTNLNFEPIGIILILSSATGGIANPYIGGISCIKNESGWSVQGIASGTNEKYGVPITGATVTTTSTSITISNIIATENSSTFVAKFSNDKLSCFVWG